VIFRGQVGLDEKNFRRSRKEGEIQKGTLETKDAGHQYDAKGTRKQLLSERKGDVVTLGQDSHIVSEHVYT